MRFVEQNSHQLRHGQRRMRVIELDGHFLWQLVPVVVRMPETPHQIPQGTGHQEVFLYKPQALAEAGGIVRVEHPCEGFRSQSLRDGAYEVAVAECFEIKGIGRGRGPKPEGVDGFAAEAHDRPVVRHTNQLGRPSRNGLEAPAAHLKRAVQGHFNCLPRPSHLPGDPGGATSYLAVPVASRP